MMTRWAQAIVFPLQLGIGLCAMAAVWAPSWAGEVSATAQRRSAKRVIQSFAFSPDGSELALTELVLGAGSSPPHGELVVVRVPDLTEVGKVVRDEWLGTVAYSPDGKMLAAGGAYGLEVWDRGVSAPGRKLKWEAEATVRILGFSGDGKHVVAAGLTGPVAVIDVSQTRAPNVLGHTGQSHGWAFSPLLKCAALGFFEGRVAVINIEDGTREAIAPHDFPGRLGDPEFVELIAIAQGAERLASVTNEPGDLQLWDLAGKRRCWARPSIGPALGFGAIAFSASEDVLIAAIQTQPWRLMSLDPPVITGLWAFDSRFGWLINKAVLRERGQALKIAESPRGGILALLKGSGRGIGRTDANRDEFQELAKESALLLYRTDRVTESYPAEE